MLTTYAPAKINLVLEVLGKYDDNNHQIRSIAQTITLYDVLSFEMGKEISLECNESSLQAENLVIKAAKLFQEVTNCRKGVRIGLRKNIPWGAGLGGGSSDAASTLVALNALWETNFARSRLAHLASQISSDAPLFVYGGTTLVEGGGEKVSPLPDLPPTYFVLHVPPLPRIPNKTSKLYSKLDAGHFTKGESVRIALQALEQGKTIDASLMFNIFEAVAFDVFSQLDKYKGVFEQAAGSTVHLTGSGPCLFTPVQNEEKANEVCLSMQKRGLECYVTTSLSGVS
ncbi:4-diphosphocytidyl-2-C-methyl-D-erythritol kinase [subsurface metagenome]